MNIEPESLNDMLDAYRDDIIQKTTAATVDLVRKVQNKNDRRFASLEQDMTSVKAAVSAVEPQLGEFRSELARLRAVIADSDKPPPAAPPVRPGFFDPPDPALLRINCAELISKTAVTESLFSWLDQACERSDWSIFGDPISKLFTLQFHGPVGTGARRAQKALSLLKRRLPSGRFEWIEQTVTVQNIPHKLYIGEDKNPAQRKLEHHTKIAERIVRSLYPAMFGPGGTAPTALFPNKRDGKLKVSNVGVLKLTVVDEVTTTFGWNNERVAALGWDKDEIIRQFTLATARREEQWDS